MPFDATPSVSTYQQKNISLAHKWDTRDKSNTQDISLLNCYLDIDKDTGESYVVKRQGTKSYPYTIPVGTIRGYYYWKDQDKLFIAYGTTIDILQASTGTYLNNTPGWTTANTGEVGFCEFQKEDSSVYLVVTDGDHLGYIGTDNIYHASTDPNVPYSHLPHPVYIDGYLFLAKRDTGDIYNSKYDDAMTFLPGGFISAEIITDNIVRLGRINNYLVVFGSESIEYFYDAGISTGSPLQRIQGQTKLVGYRGGYCLYKDYIFFVGGGKNADKEVYVMDGTNLSIISTPAIKRFLAPDAASYGAAISYDGRTFYVLSQGAFTYQWDVETKLWTQLALAGQTNFQVTFSASVPFTGYGYTSLMVCAPSQTIRYFDSTQYTDSGVAYTRRITTPIIDFGTQNNKFGGRATIVGDRAFFGSGPVGIIEQVSWSDNDYQTWSSPRFIDMSKEVPCTFQLGRFRRRAFKLEQTSSQPSRVKYLQLDYNIGSR